MTDQAVTAAAIPFSDARKTVEGPSVPPFVRGVLRVAELRDVPADDGQIRGVEYLSDACAEGAVWADLCQAVSGVFCGPAQVDPDPAKFFDAIDWVESLAPMTIYAGTECRFPDDGLEERAERRQAAVEGYFLDVAVVAGIDAQGTDITDTPGTPHTITEAIGRLEDFAAGLYWGQPNILGHQSTTVCADGEGLLHPDDLTGDILTINKSRWASLHTPSTGIPAPKYLYIVGAILVIRGPVASFNVPEVVRPDGTCDPARQLAERVYVPSIECLAARVEVDC